LVAGLACLAASSLLAQDPVKVDAKHYKVEFENDQVRVLRIRYGPHEKSVLHEHPDSVAVFLTEQKGKFTFADGKAVERDWKTGEARWTPAEKHLRRRFEEAAYAVQRFFLWFDSYRRDHVRL
jgi:hypothetical protein